MLNPIIVWCFELFVKLLSSWPLMIFGLFLIFKKPLQLMLNSIAIAIEDIKEVRFKELALVLQNKSVPEESKLLLTKYFIDTNEDVKKSLGALSALTVSLEPLIEMCTNQHRQANVFYKTSQKAIQDFRSLYDCLRLFPMPQINIFCELIKEIIGELKTIKDRPILESAIPVINALMKLDQHYAKKDPRDFEKLKELEGLLLKCIRNT